MKLRVAAATDPGRVRRENEDAYLAVDLGPLGHLLAVADGLGGHSAGEVASRLACQVLHRSLAGAAPPPPAGGDAEPGGPELAALSGLLLRAAEEANRRVHEDSLADARHAGMGTTLTAAWVWGGFVFWAHVGDSRGYLWHGGELIPCTADHSIVGELIRRGELAAEEANHHPQRHILTRALGTAAAVEVDTRIDRLAPGDALLLATDGLTSLLDEEELAEWVRAAAVGERATEARTAELVARACERGGPDNVTVVMAERVDGERG